VHHLVNPAASFNVVKASNEDIKVFEELFREILYRVCIPFDLHFGTAILHNFSSDFCLIPPNIFQPKIISTWFDYLKRN
jgi:hypothetical protein